jgi:hypothetical protein
VGTSKVAVGAGGASGAGGGDASDSGAGDASAAGGGEASGAGGGEVSTAGKLGAGGDVGLARFSISEVGDELKGVLVTSAVFSSGLVASV